MIQLTTHAIAIIANMLINININIVINCL